MARLTAPLLSLRASGSIAKALVFASWKGIPYARVHVIPANPQSVAQVAVRNIFANLSEMWKRMQWRARRPFDYAARGVPLTPRNVQVRENVGVLQGEGDLDNLVMSVATGQAINMLNIVTADGADGTITVTSDAPAAPAGYTLLGSIGVAVLDGDPEELITRITYEWEAAAAPWAFIIDVPADGLYQVGIYALWNHVAEARQHCSVADRTQVTVTGN